MMKTNPVGILLALLLVAGAVATAWLFFSYLRSARKLQPLQTEVLIIKRNQAAIQGLLSEAVEYGKRDPTIEPLLQSMGIKVRTNGVQSAAKTTAK